MAPLRAATKTKAPKPAPVTTKAPAAPAPEETKVVAPKPKKTKATVKTAAPKPTKTTASVFYKNCTEVKAAGAAPIRPGDPGWQQKFDRDGDGVGCET